MPPKKKICSKILQNVKCQSYTDVHNLSLGDLNSFCEIFAVDIALPRSAKVNAVCHCMGISTAGGDCIPQLTPKIRDGLTKCQVDEFESITPAVLYCLTDWTTDLSNVPAVDDNDVKKYLLQTDILDTSAARTYKISRPYQLKGFVHSLRFHPMPLSKSFCAVRAMCNPSQSTNKDDIKLLHVILDKISGQPIGGHCTCTVG